MPSESPSCCLRQETGGDGIVDPPSAAGLTDVATGASARVAKCWDENLASRGQSEHRVGIAPARGRRRLPGDALIALELGLGLTEEDAVRHWLETIVPAEGQRAGTRGRAWWFTDVV